MPAAYYFVNINSYAVQPEMAGNWGVELRITKISKHSDDVPNKVETLTDK
jgi:hypothetical protein